MEVACLGLPTSTPPGPTDTPYGAALIFFAGAWTVIRSRTSDCPGCPEPSFGTGGMAAADLSPNLEDLLVKHRHPGDRLEHALPSGFLPVPIQAELARDRAQPGGEARRAVMPEALVSGSSRC
jgi:hypothetical protein